MGAVHPLRQRRYPEPLEVRACVTPSARVQLLEVSATAGIDAIRAEYPRVVYTSLHTTAGYLEQRTVRALAANEDGILAYLRPYLARFPRDAGYQHDLLHLRAELTREQQLTEPKNAHAHLVYIASGLSACVSYVSHPGEPVHLVDLDGVYGDAWRQRHVRVVGYTSEVPVPQKHWTVPIVGNTCVDLSALSCRLFEQLGQMVRSQNVTKGRVRLTLAAAPNIALTVNEYEPLLIVHDLAAALQARALVLRRGVSFLISDDDTPGFGRVIRGPYQSPILMLLGRPIAKSVALTATVSRFV
jgi:hypothetical protein